MRGELDFNLISAAGLGRWADVDRLTDDGLVVPERVLQRAASGYVSNRGRQLIDQETLAEVLTKLSGHLRQRKRASQPSARSPWGRRVADFLDAEHARLWPHEGPNATPRPEARFSTVHRSFAGAVLGFCAGPAVMLFCLPGLPMWLAINPMLMGNLHFFLWAVADDLCRCGRFRKAQDGTGLAGRSRRRETSG